MTAVARAQVHSQGIIFLLNNLPDLDTLRAGLPANAEVHILDASGDALAQMATILSGRNGVEAIHLLTHGGPGSLDLGTVALNSSTLADHGATLSSIRTALSADADFLIYGCDVAAGDTGHSFIGQLSALTGADVAASTDLTGAAALGGDWDLEVSTGAVEASALQVTDFAGVLGPTINNLSTFNFTEGGVATPVDADITLTGGANYGDGYIQFDVTSGKDAGDQLKLAGGGNVTVTGNKVFYSGTQVGTIDSFYNGSNGQALRINLINQTVAGTSPVVNGDFSNGLANWTKYTGHVDLGVTQIAGFTTPELAPSAYPSQTPGRNDNDLSSGYDNPIVTVVNGRLKLEESNMTTASYGVVHGPAAFSDAFAATTGMVLKFDWQANNINDDYHVVGYLLNTANGAATIALQSYGATGSGTARVTVPSDGNYRFVFVSGTFDATGGTVAGASMYIDNIRVEEPFVTDAVVTALARQVTYQNTSESPTAPAKTVTVSTKNSLNETTSAGATVDVTPVNDAPGITSPGTQATLAGINEDQSSATNTGATVGSLFTPRFTDVDSGASLGGIVVVGDASTGAQGTWQYSTDGSNWFDIDTVSTADGLVLSTATKLRFEPAANWYGTPGALTVHLLDNSQGSYTSGGTRVMYDTVNDTGSSPASSGAVNLGTTVASVNDLPYFTSTAGAASLKETAAYDDAYTTGEVELDTGALTGTLAGKDVEDGASVAFGIRGGTASTDGVVTTVTKTGFFGTLTLNTTTKKWTYTPTNFAAINALGEKQHAADTFDFSITDTAGATTSQRLTITYTGTNDIPVVKAGLDPIPDLEFDGNGSWSYQIPADVFTDADGTNLTYTVEVVDGSGNVLDTITNATGSDQGKPSNWLIFNEASRTLSGTPTVTAPLPLHIKVTASDGSASVSDTFTVTLNPPTSDANPAAPNVEPTTTDDHVPVLSIGGNAAYTENAVPKALNPALDLTDVDSTTLASATVTLSEGKVTGDVLALASVPGTMGNIVGVYDANSGVLSLSSDGGTATLAQWQAALKAVTFHSTSDDPGASRTVSWQVNDGVNDSNVGATTIAVTSVNDAPVATKLADVTVDTSANWSYDVDGTGNALFTDPEGQAITYSATLADGTALPSWLSFDASTHTFSGNPPAGTPYLNLKVAGTDASGATGETTFTLNLTAPASGAASTNSEGSISISGTGTVGSTLTAAAPTDADNYTGTVTYQWQMSSDAGATWVDIGGATSSTFSLAQAQSGKQVRVQAFYTDDGGFAEAPLSNALSVAVNNITGTVTINGSMAPGETLVAALSDPNGVVGVTPTYTWYRGDSSGAQTTVVGGNFSSYTLTNDDGGKYITVKVTYADTEGSAETVADSTDGPIQLGAVAPVAVDDTTAATEASGVSNGTPGINPTGNVLTNDTDANTGDTRVVTSLRSGSSEGAGELAEELTDNYTVSGLYGTLTINKNGTYTYTVDQDNATVQALNVGGSLSDTFNYTVTDGTLKSDIGVLTVTVNGANDAMTLANGPTLFTAVEDSKTSLVLPSDFVLRDPDTAGNVTVKLVASEGKLSGVSSAGVTVTGNDSGTLTLTGSLQDINVWLKTADNVAYTTSPNDNGAGTATIALKANDGATDVTLATVNVDVTATNDAPRLDLNADNSMAAGVDVAGATGADLTGNDHAVVFRPRGEAVQVVDGDVTITDIDGDTTLVKATVEITAGAWDNARTIYETLSSTASTAGIAITGNGTGTNGLTNATKLTLTGVATHAQYQTALKTIVYNNSNENAFAGNRSITIALFDKETADGGLESNASAFTITAANAAVSVGQKIYIGGNDTGTTVAQVIDGTHFVASGALPTLSNNAAMTFWLDGVQVTTASAKAALAATGYAPAAATSTVQVLWTPVVDLNGNAASGVGYTSSYTEGSAGTFITSTDALVTDQDGNLKTVTVTLNNAADSFGGGSTETLFMAAAIVANLSTNGITTTFYDASNNVLANGASGVHKIVFSGNKDATTFQLGLRAVQYKNTSENPSITPRTVSVDIVDQDNNTGVSASTTINITPVNDAPVKGGDFAATLNEGAVYVFTTGDLNSTDVDDAAGTLKYLLTSKTTHGTIFRDSNNNGAIDAGEAIDHVYPSGTLNEANAAGVDGYFTQAEVAAGRIKYLHDGSETTIDSFAAKVVDGGEDGVTFPSGAFSLSITPQNDAPSGVPVVTGTLKAGETLTADTSGISDGDGPATLTFGYQWEVSTNGGTNWSDIGGATGSTYTLADADSGKQVRVKLTYTDAGGTAEAIHSSAASVTLTNSAPTGSLSIAGTPVVGGVLTAVSTIDDADGMGPLVYKWETSTDGSTWTQVTGATAPSYTPGATDAGKQFRVTASYTDGRGSNESVLSAGTAAVVDVNNAPFLKATGANPTVADGSAALYSGVTATTVESGQHITGLTLQVGGLLDGDNEKLVIDGQEIVLRDALTGTTTGGAGYSVAVHNGTATVTLSHAGLTAAQTQALVAGLKYKNAAVAPQAGMRIVTVEGLKDDGGTANSGDDTAVVGVTSTVSLGTVSNTAPTPTGAKASTLDEGAVHTLTLAELGASDPEHPAGGLIVSVDTAPTHGKLFLDANTNGVPDAGEALGAGGTFTLADVSEGRVKFAHDASETTADSFAYKVSDGLATSGAQTYSITVNPVDDAPTLAATSLNPAYVEGAAAATLFGAVAASAVEAGQEITQLKLMVSGLRDGAAEQLVIDGQALALTDGTTGTTTANGVGYSVVVVGGTATVTIAKTADNAAWTALIGGIQYENTSEAPTAGKRAVTLLELQDNGSGPHVAALSLTSNAVVAAVNDAPTLSSPGITVTEGASLSLDTTAIHAIDVDSSLSALSYTLSTAPTHGTVYIDANGNGIKDAGEALAANSQFTHAQLASGKVRYVHDGSESDDSFGVRASDGSGSSAEVTVDVARTPVNDVPSIAGLGTDVLTYAASQSNVARLVEQGGDALVVDPDSANFAGGALRVSISFNRDPSHDVLSIANVGTGAGQIGVADNNVSYGGTVIGTVSGGSGTDDLVVTFDADATPEAVSAVVRAVQFQNDQDDPAAASRTISFALNDGASDGQAAPVSVNVNMLTGVSPSISIGNGFFVMENTTLVTALSAVDPNNRPITFSVSPSSDVNNEDGGKFIVASGNLLRFVAAPDYEAPTDIGADRTYKVMVRATNDIGVYVEQALTINLLDQLNENVAPGDTEGPVFGYATVNGNTLTISYNDASALDAVNVPAAGAFTVNVGGAAVAVNAVAVNASAHTVVLTLASAVSAGQNVTVAYADPSAADDAVALQDAAGNDAATLAASAVTNLTPGSGGSGGGSGSGGGGTAPTTPPAGTITSGSSTTSTNGNGTTTTTTTGKIGTLSVVETVTVTTDGKTERVLVYIPQPGSGSGNDKPVDLPLLYENVPGSDSNTTVTLPVGVGLTSVGNRTPSGSTPLDLIELIQTTVNDTDITKGSMVNGGQAFLDSLPSGATLWINKIALTAPSVSTPPATPIVVNGAANNSSSTFTGDKLEALVIDGSQLPAGTKLELQNVDFAVIVGDNLVVRGGNGVNVVYGGAGSQDILLGADDDVLYGGDGDDTVGSAGGADLIFGNAGNDTVFGGAGSDILHGGKDVDVAVYEGNIDRYSITRDHGKTIVRSLDRLDDIDTLVNVETIRFGDQTYTVENPEYMTWIASMYGQALDRQADLGGFQFWTNAYANGVSIGEIVRTTMNSDEFFTLHGKRLDGLDSSAQVDLLYQSLLGREAEEAGHNFWVQYLANGHSIESAAEMFIQSPEMATSYVIAKNWEFFL